MLSLSPVHAQTDGITVRKSEAKPGFPQNISFIIDAESAAKIDQISLVYGVSSDTCLSSQARHEMELDPSSSVDLHWEWDLSRSGNLPPGVEVWWQWEIHAADGASLTTDIQKMTIEDPNYEWRKLQRGQITLYWARGSSAFGAAVLDQAVTSLNRLSKTAGLDMQEPIRLMIYPDTEALKKALVHTTDWMGGVAFPEYDIVLIGMGPTELDWAKEVVPHELAHLVTDVRTFNCLNSYPPAWLHEGLAMYAEGPVLEEERQAVLNELKKGTLPTLTSLANGFPADSGQANLAYSHSRLVVTFMIEKYGTDKLQALLDQFKTGAGINAALYAVYGLDTAGMEQTWRASLGFGEAPGPSFVMPTTLVKPTAIPTLALSAPYQGTDTPEPTASPTVTATLTASPTAETALTASAVPGNLPSARSVPAPFLWLILAGVGGLVALLILVGVSIILFILRKKK